MRWFESAGVAVVAALVGAAQVPARAAQDPGDGLEDRLAAVAPRVISWRRDIHRHPELGNQEVRTAALVADHLRAIGLDEVRTQVGITGVVGILRGQRPGPVIALRADMDALPIKEATGLPFASTDTGEFDGAQVPVMHACGHDAHTAMLMGAAQILAGMRAHLAGSVMFIFQPAEEGGPPGVLSGAQRMIADGIFAREKPEAVLALHVEPGPVGQIMVRPGPMLSGASDIAIDLTGQQTHGGRPWEGTDLVNLSADIVKSLATITSRQMNVFELPNVVSIGSLQAGVRMNILPGTAQLRGTIRSFDAAQRGRLKGLIRTSVEGLSKTYGASAKVAFEDVALVTGNDPDLLRTVMPALEAAAGEAGVDANTTFRGAAEDFSYFEQDIPGLYYILGSTPEALAKGPVPTNHSDRFDIDERVLAVGVRAHVLTALAVLEARARD